MTQLSSALVLTPQRRRLFLSIALTVVAAAGLGAAGARGGLRATSTNPAPTVLPTLREWHGGSGNWKLSASTRIVVDTRDATALSETADTFRADLHAETGYRLAVVSGTPQAGDIFLSLHGGPTGLGAESYRLEVGDVLRIGGASETGVFYGTQTVEQILKADPRRVSVPRGNAVDWPDYPERAQMLDVGRKFFPVSYLKKQIRLMAWEKLNTFHLHFSDWEGFRIKTKQFPGLASSQAYTAADLNDLQSYAKRYHVTIVPEVDLPAHANAITSYDPTLRFSCPSMDYDKQWVGGDKGGWTLNITSQHTLTFVHQLLAAIIPMFHGPYFDVGGDEYQGAADMAACPELVAYQQAHGFATPGDVFIDFFNSLDKQVRSYGKTTEMWGWWNLFGVQTSIVPNRDIIQTAASWDVAPDAAAGYKVVGSDFSSLYVVPGLGQHIGQFGYVDPTALYANFSFVHAPGVLGYKLARWSDASETQPIDWVDFFARRPQQILADRLWGGPRAASVWQFFARADAIGGPPASQLTAIPKSGWQALTTDDQPISASDTTSANAFDDDPYTSWSSAAGAGSHELTVDLGANYRLGGFRYLPPQDGSTTGRVGKYQLEVSSDGTDWRSVASGQFANDQSEKTAVFAPVSAQFVRFRALSSADGSSLMSVAELTLLRAPSPAAVGKS